MKKIVVLLILIFYFIACFSQEKDNDSVFYYYRGDKIYLPISQDRFLLYTRDSALIKVKIFALL